MGTVVPMTKDLSCWGLPLSLSPGGAKLLLEFLRQDNNKHWYSEPRMIPLAARPVLHAVCDLVAMSADGVEYRLRDDFANTPGGEAAFRCMGWSITRRVALHMELFGADEDIAHQLHVLQKALFIELTDGGVRMGR